MRRQRRIFAAAAGLAALLLPAAGRAAEDPVVHVYNWSDYIAPDTLAGFERETGVKAVYDVYDSNDTLEAKLLAGRSGYDLVFPTATPFFANHVQAGLYRALDKAKIPNAAGLDAGVMRSLARLDAGNTHGLPYLMAATAIGYNAALLAKAAPGAPLDSWALAFDPKVLARAKTCGVSWLDAHEETIPAALAYAGKDPLSLDAADLPAAAAVLNAARPALRYIHSSSYINDLANGNLCVAMGYAGDLVQARARAREAGRGVEIGIFIPKEGAPFNVDVMAIPKDAPHPDNAHRLIDFLLRPAVIGAITNAVGYANAVPAADAHVAAAIRADPVIYPPAAVRERLFSAPPAPRDYERARVRAWTRIKTRY